jgi:preprotein translocase subunit SecG
MLTILITIVHVIVALILILVVLLQTGKRADLAGAFGGGGSQTAFGTRGAATLLSKVTTTAAVLFMLTSLGLSLVSTQPGGQSGTVLPDEGPADVGLPAYEAPPLSQPEGMPALPEEMPAESAPAEDQQS